MRITFLIEFRRHVGRRRAAIWRMLTAVVACISAFTGKAYADDPGIAFFETRIRPLLVTHCYECHSADASAAGNLQGALYLDTRSGMRTGGDAGPAVLPGDPENSLLLAALRREVDQMPPAGRLPDEEIDAFAKWIAMGAPDPREGGIVAPTPRRTAFAISDEDRAHWAFQTVQDAPPPDVTDAAWVRNDIDRFVLARLELTGGRPGREADRYTLLRRTTYALTGLPPTPDDVAEFVADGREQAFEVVVDRLLASPEFGVHWARHWLDGVRYADSIDKSGEYRKWVIRACNTDLPYDQFVRMQIAGDLLPADGVPPDETHASGASLDGLTATGMLALAEWEIVGRDLAVAEIVDSQIDVVGRHILGLTLSCARCHDHKFDPVSIDDYYSLAGIFFSSHIVTGKLVADDRLTNEYVQVPLLSVEDDADNQQIEAEIAALETRIAELKAAVPQAARLADIEAELSELEKQIEKASTSASRQGLDTRRDGLRIEQQMLLIDQLESRWPAHPAELTTVAGIRSQIAALQASKHTAATAVAIRDGGVPGSSREQIGDAPVYLRGEYQHPGAIVARRFPAMLAGDQQTPIGQRTTQSGRLELADWIAAPQHPLTARVMANRVWQHLIGQGLVRTPDNFGRLGEPPTHPELLDHLAGRFVESGWSVKRLIREIVLSATFRQSSLVAPEDARGDPENRLLGRMNRRRLTYEELRDSLHFVGGRLTPATQAPVPGNATVVVRTIFEPVDRRQSNAAAAIFDAPDPKAIVPIRAETTTAPQALFLMNNPLAAETSEQLSARLTRDPLTADGTERYNQLWLTLYGRPPAADELDDARSLVGRLSWQ
ncbi:MAG: DUF1553 domain-containing protein, partial [Planctomycetaceae bacterium]|nr:DUF1553 domain-containing protein [Planctomycetaceae bacterium]